MNNIFEYPEDYLEYINNNENEIGVAIFFRTKSLSFLYS